jgi:hypothetical protein
VRKTLTEGVHHPERTTVSALVSVNAAPGLRERRE